MDKYIYCDNAATTEISDVVFNSMLPYLKENYGNPSSIYKLGRDSKKAIEIAREKTAKALNCDPKEIIFTSCGTESDNWAIKSTARRLKSRGKTHIITTVFEHHAVLHTCEQLEKEGFSISYIPVSKEGLVNPEDIKNAITEETAIVSVMFANNEIGTIQPIKEIAEICREKKVIFHTDAVQALGNVSIDLNELGVDLASFSGHKIHAPKGIGCIYIRKGVALPTLIQGGGQERAKRAGTENVAGIVGFGTAIEKAVENIPAKIEKLTPLRNKLIDGILKLPHTRLNGSKTQRLCGNVNISIEGIEGESLLLMLDMFGIAASSGSACTSGSLDPSHVLLSLGLVHEVAHGSLRLSIGENFTDSEADYILETIPKVVEKLRAMSPLWEKIQNNDK
ncbi:MAG: cysteine desulfurase NifS [Oscillospiraceae bacterium]|jgi:cysteine desulfurase|nr:cysteine desulfurase NifS [Oscillospiraceae bacterium]